MIRLAYHGCRLASLAAIAIGGLLALTHAPGCGASYQAVYEGEVRFEHCYRLDEESGIPLTQQRECWREWTQFYTYGQTRDRLEYALRRQRELTSQIENPGGNVEKSTADAEAPPEPVEAPPPTSPFVPPPRVQSNEQDDGSKEGGVSMAELLDMLTSGKQPSSQPCLMRCLAAWRECNNKCDSGDGDCSNGCNSTFRECSPKCFEK